MEVAAELVGKLVTIQRDNGNKTAGKILSAVLNIGG
jgi:hypothetical protein